MTKLRIAPGLALDADYVGGGTFALLAKKGAGKTYTGRVMAEEMWQATIPFVVLDPMGAWWGLRSSADGKSDGIPVGIFGGEHGDAPLERTGGKLMADLFVEERLSMILDMRGFGTRSAERQFALDFLERLNKDVLTQVDGLVAMRMLSPQDRNAIDDWVRDHGDMDVARGIKASLPELANGECWWWVPELDVLKRVQVRQSRTFDSSPTKRRGERRREPTGYADVDMDAIEAKMAATIERAKAEDPELVEQLGGTAGKVVSATNEISGGLAKLTARRREPQPQPRPATHVPARSAPRPVRPDTAGTRTPPEPMGDLTGPQQRVLDALAWLEAVGFPKPSKIQVGFIAGYRVGKKVGGTFGNILGELRGAGLIDYPTAGNAMLTDEGRALAREADIEQSTDGLQRAVYERLAGPERRVLEVIVAAWPDAVTKQQAGEMRNPLRRSALPEVLAGLAALHPLVLSDGACQALKDMTVYAAVGRDRRKLTLAWVEQTREMMEGANRWEAELKREALELHTNCTQNS